MFSATAIADFLACRHLTALNRARAEGEIEKPFFADPGLELLKKLGLAHEEEYLRTWLKIGGEWYWRVLRPYRGAEPLPKRISRT